MNTAHVHLLLNHVAILGAIFSTIVLIWGAARKDRSINTVALVGFVLAALAAIPVFLTGEGAEDIVENMGGVSKSMIESHEESATVALWLVEVLGAGSLVILLAQRFQWKFAARMYVPLLLLAIVASGAIGYTGYVGGKIHHTEIYQNATSSGTQTQSGEQKEEHEDD